MHGEPGVNWAGDEVDSRVADVVEALTPDETPAEAMSRATNGQIDDRPEWLPAKFKNPEVFAEAYLNLERTYHAQNVRLREAEEALAALASGTDDPVEQLAEHGDAFGVGNADDWLSGLEEQDPATLLAMAANEARRQAREEVYALAHQQVNPDAAGAALLAQATQINDSIAARYPEVDPAKVAEVLAREQDVSLDDPVAFASQLTAAYEHVRYAEQTARTQSDHSRALKMQAQTLSGSPARPVPLDADTDYWRSVVDTPSNRFGK